MNSIHSPNYYDTFAGQLLVGGDAVDAHIEAGGHPADIFSLPDLLVRETLSLSTYPPKQDVREWGKPDFIANGRWLDSVVPEPLDPRKRKITELVLKNAYNLGIGFSVQKGSRFQSLFGSTGAYYREARLARTHRVNRSSELDIELIVYKLNELGDRLGRRPNWKDLIKAHQEDPDIPEPQILKRLSEVDGKSGYEAIFDLAGYDPKKRFWTADDCLAWAVNYRRNHGSVPRESDINFAASRQQCASRRIFRNHFGTIANLQSLVEEYVEGPEIEAAILEQEHAMIADAQILRTRLAEDGKVVLQLAATQHRPGDVVEPGTLVAKSILAKVRRAEQEPKRRYGGHSIPGTKRGACSETPG